MADPEVQKILNDPAMRMILEQMQNDPNAIQVRPLFQTKSVYQLDQWPIFIK